MREGISIIIPNYNGKDLLSKYLPFLLAAFAHTSYETEVIIVDDASKDDSIQMLRINYPMVRIVAQKTNQGFSKTCNNGAAHAIYNRLLFLNSDMKVEPDFLEYLGQALTPEAFAVSGKIMEKSGAGYVNVGLNYGYIKNNLFVTDIFKLEPDAGLGEEKTEILWASGGMMLCWAEKFHALSGFDPLYAPFYWEDSDLSYRAWKMGWPVLYEPRSVVFHEHQGTIGKFYRKKYVGLIQLRNQILFTLKNMTDQDIFSRVVFNFVLRFFIPNFSRQLSAVLALKYIPAIMRQRHTFAAHIVKSDRELLQKFIARAGLQN